MKGLFCMSVLICFVALCKFNITMKWREKVATAVKSKGKPMVAWGREVKNYVSKERREQFRAVVHIKWRCLFSTEYKLSNCVLKDDGPNEGISSDPRILKGQRFHQVGLEMRITCIQSKYKASSGSGHILKKH